MSVNLIGAEFPRTTLFDIIQTCDGTCNYDITSLGGDRQFVGIFERIRERQENSTKYPKNLKNTNKKTKTLRKLIHYNNEYVKITSCNVIYIVNGRDKFQFGYTIYIDEGIIVARLGLKIFFR